jgi:hypothetical protein
MRTWIDQQPHDILGNLEAMNILKQWMASVRMRTSCEMVISILDYLDGVLMEHHPGRVSCSVEILGGQDRTHHRSTHLPHFLELDPTGTSNEYIP